MVVIFSVTELGNLFEVNVVIDSFSPSNFDVEEVLFVDVGGAIVGVSTSVSPVWARSRSFSLDRISLLNGMLEDFVDGMVAVAIVCTFEVS